jgi:hypothetical protein
VKKVDLLGDLFDAAGLTKSAAPPEDPTARCARLDAERNEADRAAKRGYDVDVTAPSHAEYLERAAIPTASPAEALAHDLVKLCTQHGLKLHATPEGIFVEVTAGDWREVMSAIEGAGYHHATV